MARADKPQTVRRDCPHALDMPKECRERFARLDVPHADRVVEAARDEDWLRLCDYARTGALRVAFGVHFDFDFAFGVA